METPAGSASGELPDVSGGPVDASNGSLDASGEPPDAEIQQVEPKPARSSLLDKRAGVPASFQPRSTSVMTG
jgi:hypothetical protein